MKRSVAIWLSALAVPIGLSISAVLAGETKTHDVHQKIQVAIDGEHRSQTNKARDQYRHPLETLEFFGLRDDMTVMEIWPGAGWYTDILGPVLKDNGHLIAVAYEPYLETAPENPSYRFNLDRLLLSKFSDNESVFGAVEVAGYVDPIKQQLGQSETVDLIVTFRSAHGWVEDGVAEEVFADFYDVLKHGGHLGIVQHRATAGTDPKQTAGNGYVSESTIIELAEQAGFELAKKSEINANFKDTHDHPEGVWTLPPSLRLGDTDRAKYQSIGESDRMTLLFLKG